MAEKNTKAWIALISICIIWGTTYLFLKIGVTEMAPFLFSGIRQVAAGIIMLLLVMIIAKPTWPPMSEIALHCLAGFLMITLGNGLVAYGELSIPSGMAAVICATMPVWVAMINFFTPGSIKLTWVGYLSVFVGIGGILLLFSDSLSSFGDTQFLIGSILTLIATFTWIAGSYIIKRGSKNYNVFLTSSIHMLSGGLGLFVLSAIFDMNYDISLSTQGWLSLVYLILMGSVVAMGAYAYALKALPLPVVSIYAYINPVVAIFLGWIILDEKLSFMTLLACVIIIAAVVLLNQPISKQKNA